MHGIWHANGASCSAMNDMVLLQIGIDKLRTGCEIGGTRINNELGMFRRFVR